MGPTFVGHVDVDVLDSPTGPLGLLGLISQFTQFTLFSFFISYLWLMLDFYSFAISLLQNCLMIAQEGLCFFFFFLGLYPLFARCLINVQDKF